MTVDRGRLRGRHHGPRDAQRAAALRGRGRIDPAARHRDHRPGRDHRRRHVAPALRAPDGAALRGRRARRLPHARHHEAQPAGRGADRALRAGTGRRPLAASSSRNRPTIGVRWTAYQRSRLDARDGARWTPPTAPVTFKVSRLEGRVVTVTPEFEEVRRIARDRGLPVREVLEQARVEGRRLLDHPLTPSPARHTVGGAFPASDPSTQEVAR